MRPSSRQAASGGKAESRTVAIVPAAGFGKRLGLRTKKPFVLLKGKPIIARTLEALERCSSIDEIVIAAEAGCISRFNGLVSKYRFKKVSRIVPGGSTRFQSVKNCLDQIGPHCEIVVIHDAARPFIDSPTIEGSIKEARKSGACIVAIQETDTVKLIGTGLVIKKTLDRDKIFRAQTPQTFRYGVIKKAFAAESGCRVTDDASLVEALGKPVKIFPGSRRNIKITTIEDIRIAEAML